MGRYLFLLIILFTSSESFGQDSLRMRLMYQDNSFDGFFSDVWGYTRGGKEFAILGSREYINIYDVSDCSNPVLHYRWADGGNKIWRDFKAYGDYVYGVCDSCNEGLQVIHKDSTSGPAMQYFNVFNKAHNIFIDEKAGRLYACGTNTNFHGIHIFDLKSDPANPVLLKNVYFRDIMDDPTGYYYVHDLYVQNDTAYCSHGTYGAFRIWDMKDVNNITLIGSTEPTTGYNHSSWRHPYEPYMYVAEETPGKGLFVYDISDITDPYSILEFKEPLEPIEHNEWLAHNPFVKGERLFVSNYNDGVQVYDLSDPENPAKIAYYDIYPDNNGNGYDGYEGTWGVYPFLPSGCIVAGDGGTGFNLLKLDTIPQFSSRMPSEDLVINNAANGIVFISVLDSLYRLTVNNGGDVIKSQIAATSGEAVEVINSNLVFEDSDRGIILRAPDGDYHRLVTRIDGHLGTEEVTTLPTSAIIIDNNDLFFSQFQGGIVLKNDNLDCFHYTVRRNGTLQITPGYCD